VRNFCVIAVILKIMFCKEKSHKTFPTDPFNFFVVVCCLLLLVLLPPETIIQNVFI